jgi:CHASE2 domain-containing protein
VQSRGPDGAGFMREPFAALARPGIACAGISLGQSHVMPLAVRRAGAPASAASAAATGDDPPREDEPILAPAFALAAYGGGGRAQLLNEGRRPVLVRLQPLKRTQTIEYFDTIRLKEPQPGCEVLAPGDSVFVQLIDPYALPPLEAPPQRVAYESVVHGDPATLALLKDRIVVVGTTLQGSDRMPLPWPAPDRWGVELFAAQVDAMVRDTAIRPIHRVAEWTVMNALALVGAVVGLRLRERSRTTRVAVLAAIAVGWIAVAVAWYRGTQQLIGVPYDIVALFLGAWLANRNWRRSRA